MTVTTRRPVPSPPRRPRRVRFPLRTSWVVYGTLVTALLSVLLVEAYANSEFTPDHVREAGDQGGVPAEIISGGPVIDTTDGGQRSYHMPPRTIALTFDDGPDPVWTPRILDVLRRHGARATFFVVGSQVARHPDLTRRIATEGHELGVHTFSHPDATLLPGWQRRLEYTQTQMAIMNAAGVRTTLLRLRTRRGRTPSTTTRGPPSDRPVTSATSRRSTTPTARTGPGPEWTRSCGT